MKFGKNLLRVAEISDPEWVPYWVNYKALKVCDCESSVRPIDIRAGHWPCLNLDYTCVSHFSIF